MQAQQIDILEQNIIFAIDEIQKEKRQYINKHVQNSLNNYFLENYCVLSLKKQFGIQSGRQIKNAIQEKYQKTYHFKNIDLKFSQEQQVSLKKYYLLMLGFLEEHMNNGSLEEYREQMVRIIQEESDVSCKESSSSSISNTQWISPYNMYGSDKDKIKQWAQVQWKKLIALFVLHHTYFPHIEAIYQIWYDIFQSRVVDASTQKKKRPENNRSYKYHDLPYIINNDYHSQVPINFSSMHEQVTNFKHQPQHLLQTSHSFTSEIVQSRDITNGKDVYIKKNNKSKYQKTYKHKGREDSSFNQNDSINKNNKQDQHSKSTSQENIGDDIQSKHEKQCIERQPYKKIKKQQHANQSKNSQSSVEDKQNIQNLKQKVQNCIPIQMISSAAQDYQSKFPTQQIVHQFIKREEANNLNKNNAHKQQQSAFQKFNKTSYKNQEKQFNVMQTQIQLKNISPDSKENKYEQKKTQLESNQSNIEPITNKDRITKLNKNMSTQEQNKSQNCTKNDQNESNQFSNKLEEIEHSETQDNSKTSCQNKQEMSNNSFQNKNSNIPIQNTQMIQTFQYPGITHITQPITLQQQPVQVVYQIMPQQQITPVIQQQQVFPMMSSYQIQYVPMICPNEYMSNIQPNHVAITQQFPVYNIKHY